MEDAVGAGSVSTRRIEVEGYKLRQLIMSTGPVKFDLVKAELDHV